MPENCGPVSVHGVSSIIWYWQSQEVSMPHNTLAMCLWSCSSSWFLGSGRWIGDQQLTMGPRHLMVNWWLHVFIYVLWNIVLTGIVMGYLFVSLLLLCLKCSLCFWMSCRICWCLMMNWWPLCSVFTAVILCTVCDDNKLPPWSSKAKNHPAWTACSARHQHLQSADACLVQAGMLCSDIIAEWVSSPGLMPSVLWPLLVLQQVGHTACKNLSVGMFEVLELCTT